ncbi:hypothetical protein [Mesorhizobium sp. 1B3]|uniref:hypothetical protein n=1 Tax=Mesorhizobium sp. 1B3 TaxID=3243599 RepID=UPI003D992585
MSLLLSGFIGALIGASITLFFNIWKFHRDERTARCDEMCDAMAAAAEIASKYWATDFADDADQRVQEARIYGSQALIDGLYEDLRIVLREKDAVVVDDALSELSMAMSGGAFSVGGRSRDPDRVSKAPRAASLAMVELRRAHRRTFPLGGLMNAFHENRRRKLDMPSGMDWGVGESEPAKAPSASTAP